MKIRRHRRWTATGLIAATALVTATLTGVGGAATTAGAVEPATTWTDNFDGPALDPRWQVVNEDAASLALSDGALNIVGQPGDTYQTVNSAKNLVMLDIPAGDFTATAKLAAPVAKVYQGAGLIAWKDMDNYVRSGLTFVGALSPSGVAIENDVESGAAFSAVKFTDRPGSSGETIRLQRSGDTIATSYYDATTSAWLPAGSTTVSFETTQVGLYALAAQDGTVLPAAFDSFTVEHAEGADVVPGGSFILQAADDSPYLVADGTTLRLSPDQPTASLRLHAADLGDGALAISTDDRPLVVTDGALSLGAPDAIAMPLRITDAGGGNVVLCDAADSNVCLNLGDGGSLVLGDYAGAVRFRLSEVSDELGTLQIDGDGTGASISDTMFGIFFEDINYAADGGIYAELVRNRSFEFNSTDNSSFNGLTAWQVLNRSGAGTTAGVVNDDGRLNAMNRNYLKLTAASAGDGVRNIGFNNGIVLAAGKTYEASVWARSATAQDLTVRVEDTAGTGVLASGTVAVDGSNTWQQYAVELTALQTTDAGRLAVLAGAPSTVALDMVSVMPHDRWVGPVNGRSVLRKDLAEKVAAMKPSFVRFPGGCVTNVGTFRTYEESGFTDRQRTYQWKETIGPVEERPTNKNFWGYNQSYGIGYLEYFELAEDLGAEPLPVVSVGANGCGSSIPEMKDPAMIQRWVDDTVDLIEFANGGTDTEWGAVRAGLGHPEPFGLDMIGLGNEENTTTFEANFPKFRDAIKAKYPEIKIISNSGPDDTGSRFDTLWNFNRQQKVDMVDEHYYNDPDWFLDNNHRYDSYDREGPKVFLGEYASRGNTFRNALVEAAYMTGLQRNADVVRLASYAPLLANESHVQWSPDAIWFDNDESWESANWHVQKMFGNNVGDEVAPSTYDGPVTQPEPIKGGIFLSTWSTSAAYDNVKVTSNETGATLFSDEFADASQWSPQSGTWAAAGGRYVQSSTTVNDARSIVTGAYGKDWSNYTLELDATKLAGNEGFLVGFGAQATNDFYWWNLGGWNNSRSVLQHANGGSAGEVKAIEGHSVTTGQTYHVKVVVEGHTISLYLDGELQMTYEEPGAREQVFQVVTRDKASGDLVAKVVNTGTSPVRTQVDVSDVQLAGTATVTQLTAPSLTDTNTKANPNRITPVTRQVSGLDESFTYEFPASSVTFLRMKTVDSVAPVVSEVTVSGSEANGWYAEPATVRATATDDRSVDRIEFSVDGGPWTSRSGASGEIEVSGNGTHTVEARAVDGQGNVAEIRPVVVGIDKEAPVSSATLDAARRTVTVRAVDSGSGVGLVEYRLAGQVWTAYVGPVAVGDTATTFEHRSTDRLGNVEPSGSLTVPPASSPLLTSVTAAVAVDDTVKPTEKVQIRVQVSGSGAVPTGAVTVLEGTRVLATGSLSNGRVTLTVAAKTFSLGAHVLEVRYAGSSAYAASTDSVLVHVTKSGEMTMNPARRNPVTRGLRAWAAGAVALAAAIGGAAAFGASADAVEGDLTTNLVAWWKLDETSGTTAADSSGNGRHGTVNGTASWNAGDGFAFSGGASSAGNAIKLPDNLLQGLDNVTVDLDVWVDPALTGNWFMFNLGNLATYPNGTGYLFVTGRDSSSRFRATIAENGFATEQSASRAGGLATGMWKHVTFSITGGSPAAPGASRLYEDGVLVASNTNLTTTPALLGEPNGTTIRNFLGRSAYAGDRSFQGKLRDVRIYSRALNSAEAVEAASRTATAAAEADAAALSLGDTSAVTGNLTLPATGTSGSTITWATTDASAVSANGTVTRPTFGQPDAHATLTATVTRGTVSRTRTFEVTVLAEEQDDAGKAQAAVDAIELVHPDDVRGNLTLPTSGSSGTAFTWQSSDPAVVSATGEVTRPAHGEQSVDVTLTVTGTLNAATATRSIVVRVQPMPAPADYEAYAFAYFAGESTDDGEKIYFGASKGNDPLDYDELNDGQPVLASAFGEKGLRDPFIIRSHEGDRFYLLATDLKAYPAVDFGQAQETGSKYVEVWESTDLVHWSDQRHVKVSSDFAGNTWAPESFYDESTGEYVVYWASALYPTTDTSTRDINTSYQRMMYATTRDFVTFSEARPWVDVKRGTGRGMIDATVVKDGETFYRVIKDEASMTPRQEKSTDLRATVTGSLPTTTSTPGWQLVKEKVGVGQPNPWGGTFTNGEGPTVFRDNENPDRWYMFIDQPSYHGGQGYLAFRTDDIASGNWTSVPGADLPSSPRHGTVLPVTQTELDRLRGALQPELLVSSVEDASVSTRQGTAPVLPATLPATFGDGSTGPVDVEWDAVDPAAYAAPGTFVVQGTVASGSADHPSATVRVTDAQDPNVTVDDGEPDGENGWWTSDQVTVSVSASDDTGVDTVEAAVDGGAWASADGAELTVPVTGDGSHVVQARATDTTGNSSATTSLALKIDATVPLSRATYDTARTVEVRAADATSGVDRIAVMVGDSPWSTYTGPFTVGEDGATIRYRAVDRAGNVEVTNELVVPAVWANLLPSSTVAVAEVTTVKFGSAVMVRARVNGSGATPTGVVRVFHGGVLLASGQLAADGRVRMAVDTRNLGGPGTYTLVVRYDGDETYRYSSDTVEIKVTKGK